jgi:hypothetical protein
MLPTGVEAYDEQNGKQQGNDPGKSRSAREIVLEEIIPNRKRGKEGRSVTLSRRRQAPALPVYPPLAELSVLGLLGKFGYRARCGRRWPLRHSVTLC